MAAKKKIAKKKTVKKVAKKKAVKKTAKKAAKKSVKKVVKKAASKSGSTVTLGGNPVSTSGKLPKKGAAAPSFTPVSYTHLTLPTKRIV